MLTNRALKNDPRSRLGWRTLGWIGCLIPAVGLALAEEQERDTEVMAERPVIVVRSTSHHPDFSWTMAASRSFLGVQTVDLTPELRQHFGAPPTAGVLVAKVVEESPAAASGLRVGDVLTAVDGEEIVSPSDLAQAVGLREPGDRVDLEIWRREERLQLQATLVERQGPSVDIRQFRLPDGESHHWQWGDLEREGVIELETETLNRAIERLNEEMSSPEWHERVHSFKEHQSTLMKRLEVLEKRLQELEKELAQLPDGE